MLTATVFNTVFGLFKWTNNGFQKKAAWDSLYPLSSPTDQQYRIPCYKMVKKRGAQLAHRY